MKKPNTYGKSAHVRLRRWAQNRHRLWLSALTMIVLWATPASANPLWQFEWNARPVLVFTDRLSTPEFQRQLGALRAARDGLREREMPVIFVVGDQVTVDKLKSGLSAQALRRHAQVAAKETVLILYGKDGGVKFRGAPPINPNTLFALVDQMPMRRAEMKAAQSKVDD